MAQRERRQVPEVRRPRGAAWRALQREGLVWEGQAFLVGTDFDLATRLIVTRERLAVVRGGAVILDTPRTWLRPAPRLLTDGNVLLTILPEDQAEATGKPETLLLRMREGWSDASHLVTLLGGSRVRQRPGPRATAAWAAPMMPIEDSHAGAWAGPDTERSGAGGSERPSGKKSTGGRMLPPSIDTPGQNPDAPPAARHDPPWNRTRRAQPPIDVPVMPPTDTDTTAGSGRDPYILPARSAPAAVGRHYDWNLPPSEVVPSRESRRRRGWFFRLGSLLALVAILGLVALVAGNRYGGERTLDGAPILVTSSAVGNAGIAVATATPDTVAHASAPSATATVAPSPSPTPTSPAATRTPEGSERTIAVAGNEETAVALGVGSDLSPTATPTPSGASVDPASVWAAQRVEHGGTLSGQNEEPRAAQATATVPPATETPEPAATATATEVPPTSTATPAPTEEAAPTDTPIPSPTSTPEPPTEEPTVTAEPPTPTVEPTSTEAPTATEEATTEPPTPTTEPDPTATPSPSPEPTIPAQEASVSEEGFTSPAMEAGAFRLTVESTMKGSALPDLGLPANPYGHWLVNIVYVYNWSDTPANLVMANFGLVTADPYVEFMPLDSGTSLVGSALGYELALGNSGVATIMPGEGHRVGLLFTSDPGGRGFSLRYGPVALDLQSSLEASPNVDELGAPPPEPSLLEATVTDVIDGDTIVVEVDGVEGRVRYAGVRAPAPDDCYGPEATAANEAVISPGDTVFLERQATNAAEDGALLRDVWIDLDGASALVANELAAVGAVDVLTDTPNDRFTSWLQVTAAEAAFLGTGMWGACGDGDGGTAATLQGAAAFLPRPPALSGAS